MGEGGREEGAERRELGVPRPQGKSASALQRPGKHMGGFGCRDVLLQHVKNKHVVTSWCLQPSPLDLRLSCSPGLTVPGGPPQGSPNQLPHSLSRDYVRGGHAFTLILVISLFSYLSLLHCPFLKGLQTKYSSSYTPAPWGRQWGYYSALTGTIQPWERHSQVLGTEYLQP